MAQERRTDEPRAGDQVSISIEPGTLLVVSEWDQNSDLGQPPMIRGVCSSTDELHALLKRLWVYDPQSEDRRVVLSSCYDDSVKGIDPDKFATSQVVIVGDDEDEPEETAFYVWDSAKSKEAYAPLKLYWCTTDGGEEDWFMIAHTAKDAALQHAAAEGFDPEEPSAELVMVLPAELQEKGDEIQGWPTSEMLAICGAKVVRSETPRVVEIDGRTFGEGMMDHLINQMNAGVRPERN
jgi:hypothetical protein